MEKKDMKNKSTKLAAVVLSLHSPKEKIWGMLLNINQSGIWVHGIDINSFDDWSRQVAYQKEPNMGLSTMFFPMIRVEKLIKDDDVGVIKSFSSQFCERAGYEVQQIIKIHKLLNI